jgi:spore coat protein A, manganese oxidase
VGDSGVVVLSRRGFLVLAGGAGLAAAGCSGRAAVQDSAVQDLAGDTGRVLASQVPLPAPFALPLPVPPVKRPSRRDASTDYYDIVQREARVEILPGVRTAVFGYDGMFPGPTLVSASGRRTVVRHTNLLPVPTAVHLHGGNTPSAFDGYPIDYLLPAGGTGGTGDPGGQVARGSREYAYPMLQRAATLWYHDHRMDFTGPQVWRGLAGFHLVHDAQEDALPLPRGDRDVPLMIADRSFKADGSLWYPSADPTLAAPGVHPDYAEGVLGDVVLVNGAPWPVLEVAAVRHRFRLLNASNARRYRLALDPPPPGGAGLVQVGSDGGLLAAPVRHESLDIAPGERYDVVVDFAGYRPGTAVTLVNRLGSGGTGRVMRFLVTRRAPDDSAVPDRLGTVEPLPPTGAGGEVDRLWSFARGMGGGSGAGGGMGGGGMGGGGMAGMGWVINGQAFDPRRVDADPRLGAVEVWRFAAELRHPVHVHLSPFQVLSRNGGRPGRQDAGWKDTLDLVAGEYADVAVRFEQHRGRYLLHCHTLEHEDMGMMAAFEVR